MKSNLTFVLLPGLDGTGRLMDYFARQLPGGRPAQVISYPGDRAMTLTALERHVRRRLPAQPFLLIAESFGGLIGARIAAHPPRQMRGLVLSASFATFPMSRALAPLQYVIRPSLLNHRPPRQVTELLLAGFPCPAKKRRTLEEVIHSVDSRVLLSRMKLILRSNTLADMNKSRLPLLYLQALRDRLVGKRSIEEILKVRPDAALRVIDAPHFLLQLAPGAAYQAIKAWMVENRIGSDAVSRDSRRRRRILIATATAGGGHLAAAAALEEAWKRAYPGDAVKKVDILDYTPKLYRKAYSEGYVRLAEKTPELYAHAFRKSDNAELVRRLTKWRRLAARLIAPEFIRLVRDFKPDAVLCPHFMPPEALGSGSSGPRPRIMTIVTDFEAHALWMEPSVDMYFVAAEETKARLIARGVAPKKIHVTGIPISGRFLKPTAAGPIRKSLRLSPQRATVLVLAGGLGMGPLEETLRQIDQSPAALQVIVVAGKNEKLRDRLKAQPHKHPTAVLGFATNMHELMAAADLIVTKPGGLTSSEALAMGKPLLIVNPLPGQEEANSDFLLERGAAAKINRLEDLPFRLSQLMTPKRLKAMARAARSLGRPRAADTICHAVRKTI